MESYRISDNAIRQNVGDESVILNLDNGQYYGLDEIGSRMLDLIDEHGQFETVVNVLLGEYDVEVEKITADLQELLGDLKEQGIVRCELFETSAEVDGASVKTE